MIPENLGTPTMVTTATDGRRIECYGGEHFNMEEIAASFAQLMKDYIREATKEKLSAE